MLVLRRLVDMLPAAVLDHNVAALVRRRQADDEGAKHAGNLLGAVESGQQSGRAMSSLEYSLGMRLEHGTLSADAHLIELGIDGAVDAEMNGNTLAHIPHVKLEQRGLEAELRCVQLPHVSNRSVDENLASFAERSLMCLFNQLLRLSLSHGHGQMADSCDEQTVRGTLVHLAMGSE